MRDRASRRQSGSRTAAASPDSSDKAAVSPTGRDIAVHAGNMVLQPELCHLEKGTREARVGVARAGPAGGLKRIPRKGEDETARPRRRKCGRENVMKGKYAAGNTRHGPWRRGRRGGQWGAKGCARAGGGGRGGAPAAKNTPLAGAASRERPCGCRELPQLSGGTCGRRGRKLKQRPAAGNDCRAKPLLPQWRRYFLSINPHSGEDIDRQ